MQIVTKKIYCVYSDIRQRRQEALQEIKKEYFSKLCWENYIFTGKIIKLDPYIRPLTKVNLKLHL